MLGVIRNRKTFQSSALNRALSFLAGDKLTKMSGRLAQNVMVPLGAILVFLMLWTAGAKQVQTSLGELPGPSKVWDQSVALYDEHRAERDRPAGASDCDGGVR